MQSAAPIYDPDGTVKAALQAYFDAYGLGNGGYDEPYHRIRLFGILPFVIPNPPARKRALRRHDLNHVLGGYDALGTSGEIDIAGFEMGARGGCGRYWVAWAINAFFFSVGLFVRPRQLFQAFIRSQGALNAYSLAETEGRLLTRRLRDVRLELGLADNSGASTARATLRFGLFGAASLAVVILPVLALVSAALAVVRYFR